MSVVAVEPLIAMETIVPPSDPPFVSFPSGRGAHQSTEGTSPQMYYEVDPSAWHTKQTVAIGDVSIRSSFKKGLIPQLQGVWLADSPSCLLLQSQLQIFTLCFSQGGPQSVTKA